MKKLLLFILFIPLFSFAQGISLGSSKSSIVKEISREKIAAIISLNY